MDRKQEIVRNDDKNLEKTRQLYEVRPAVDIYENEDEFVLHADMPGVTKQDISVNLDNGTLFLSGVRKLPVQGAPGLEEFYDIEYVRSFSVPQTIDVSKIEAELKNGVLRLHLPKSEAVKPRQIEIKTA